MKTTRETREADFQELCDILHDLPYQSIAESIRQHVKDAMDDLEMLEGKEITKPMILSRVPDQRVEQLRLACMKSDTTLWELQARYADFLKLLKDIIERDEEPEFILGAIEERVNKELEEKK